MKKNPITEQKRLRKIDDEIWKDVANSNGKYQVSNYGRVRSFAYDSENPRVMKQCIINNFNAVSLKINMKSTTIYTHKLVAAAWLEKPDENSKHVIHLDYNVRNNHVANLKYATHEDVVLHQREREKDPNRKKQINNSKLNEKDVAILKSMIERGVPNVTIAKLFRISDMQVVRIKRGENWGHVKAAQITKDEE
jgi:hypothetical protein